MAAGSGGVKSLGPDIKGPARRKPSGVAAMFRFAPFFLLFTGVSGQDPTACAMADNNGTPSEDTVNCASTPKRTVIPTGGAWGDHPPAEITGTLYLEIQALTEIPDGGFDACPYTAVAGLYLNDNAITTVGARAFARLAALKELNLYRNGITWMAATSLDGLTRLEVLYLHGNNLGDFDYRALNATSALQTLYLGDQDSGSIGCEGQDNWVTNAPGIRAAIDSCGAFGSPCSGCAVGCPAGDPGVAAGECLVMYMPACDDDTGSKSPHFRFAASCPICTEIYPPGAEPVANISDVLRPGIHCQEFIDDSQFTGKCANIEPTPTNRCPANSFLCIDRQDPLVEACEDHVDPHGDNVFFYSPNSYDQTDADVCCTKTVLFDEQSYLNDANTRLATCQRYDDDQTAFDAFGNDPLSYETLCGRKLGSVRQHSNATLYGAIDASLPTWCQIQDNLLGWIRLYQPGGQLPSLVLRKLGDADDDGNSKLRVQFNDSINQVDLVYNAKRRDGHDLAYHAGCVERGDPGALGDTIQTVKSIISEYKNEEKFTLVKIIEPVTLLNSFEFERVYVPEIGSSVLAWAPNPATDGAVEEFYHREIDSCLGTFNATLSQIVDIDEQFKTLACATVSGLPLFPIVERKAGEPKLELRDDADPKLSRGVGLSNWISAFGAENITAENPFVYNAHRLTTDSGTELNEGIDREDSVNPNNFLSSFSHITAKFPWLPRGELVDRACSTKYVPGQVLFQDVPSIEVVPTVPSDRGCADACTLVPQCTGYAFESAKCVLLLPRSLQSATLHRDVAKIGRRVRHEVALTAAGDHVPAVRPVAAGSTVTRKQQAVSSSRSATLAGGPWLSYGFTTISAIRAIESSRGPGNLQASTLSSLYATTPEECGVLCSETRDCLYGIWLSREEPCAIVTFNPPAGADKADTAAPLARTNTGPEVSLSPARCGEIGRAGQTGDDDHAREACEAAPRCSYGPVGLGSTEFGCLDLFLPDGLETPFTISDDPIPAVFAVPDPGVRALSQAVGGAAWCSPGEVCETCTAEESPECAAAEVILVPPHVTRANHTNFANCPQLRTIAFTAQSMHMQDRSLSNCPKLEQVTFFNASKTGASPGHGGQHRFDDGAVETCVGPGARKFGFSTVANDDAASRRFCDSCASCAARPVCPLSHPRPVYAGAGDTQKKCCSIEDENNCYSDNSNGGCAVADETYQCCFSADPPDAFCVSGFTSVICANNWCNPLPVRPPSAPNFVGVANTASIAEEAFAGCASLQVYDATGVDTIGTEAFKDATGLGAIAIPTVTTIGDGAFSGTSALSRIVGGTEITTIGDRAFSGTAFNGVFPESNSLSSLGESAFEEAAVRQFSTGNILTTVPRSAFQDSAIEIVVLGKSVTTIETAAFQGATSLVDVEITGNALTFIGSRAFSGCSQLRQFNVPFGAPGVSLLPVSFADTSSLANFYFGSLASVSADAFSGSYCTTSSDSFVYSPITAYINCVSAEQETCTIRDDGVQKSADDSSPCTGTEPIIKLEAVTSDLALISRAANAPPVTIVVGSSVRNLISSVPTLYLGLPVKEVTFESKATGTFLAVGKILANKEDGLFYLNRDLQGHLNLGESFTVGDGYGAGIYIGAYVFMRTKLTTADLRAVVTVGEGAFQESDVAAVTFSGRLFEIFPSAFEECHGLSMLEIPDVQKWSAIGTRAFANTANLAFVKFQIQHTLVCSNNPNDPDDCVPGADVFDGAAALSSFIVSKTSNP